MAIYHINCKNASCFDGSHDTRTRIEMYVFAEPLTIDYSGQVAEAIATEVNTQQQLRFPLVNQLSNVSIPEGCLSFRMVTTNGLLVDKMLFSEGPFTVEFEPTYGGEGNGKCIVDIGNGKSNCLASFTVL